MIARTSQDQESERIDLSRLGEKIQGLVGAGIFHSRGDEISLFVGPVVYPVVGPIGEQFAVPEGGGGHVVTF